MDEREIQAVIQQVHEVGPTRVVINVHGEAVPPGRTSISPDIIYIRNDGWTLGAPREFDGIARKMWADMWVAVMSKGKYGGVWKWKRLNKKGEEDT